MHIARGEWGKGETFLDTTAAAELLCVQCELLCGRLHCGCIGYNRPVQMVSFLAQFFSINQNEWNFGWNIYFYSQFFFNISAAFTQSRFCRSQQAESWCWRKTSQWTKFHHFHLLTNVVLFKFFLQKYTMIVDLYPWTKVEKSMLSTLGDRQSGRRTEQRQRIFHRVCS